MAEAVADALAGGDHLLVQAGTGTGKSLAYLVPSLLHDSRVVVATATLALQHQLVERDLPRLVEAVGDLPGVDASYAVLKGRSNYACLHRIREGVPDDQGVLVEAPVGSMATKVLELRAWAEEQAESKESGERDNAPRHTDREWRQVSVSAPRVPERVQVPVRRGVLRRAGPREGAALAPDRHQPLAARHRRDRGRADDPRLRRRGDRRGARAHVAGSPRPPPTSCCPPTSTGRPSGRSGTSRATRPTTSPTRATSCARRWASSTPGRIDQPPGRSSATRWCWSGTRRAPACRRTPRRSRRARPATPTPG